VRCANCRRGIHYSPHGAIYLHDEPAWGRRWTPQSAQDGTFDNGYFCDVAKTMRAMPAVGDWLDELPWDWPRRQDSRTFAEFMWGEYPGDPPVVYPVFQWGQPWTVAEDAKKAQKK